MTSEQGRSPGPEAAARLVIRVLGTVAVELDGAPVPELVTPRVQRVLARLALAGGGPLPRDRLAWELWPDSSEAQARTNLRKLVHDIRRSLPGPDSFLDAGAHAIRWRPGAPVWADAAAFLAALARGELAAAAGHYGGDLLPACYDDWVLAERRRLRTLAVTALEELAGRAASLGRDPEVVEHARHLLRLEPLHEPALRQLMEALARCGRRSEALHAYHRGVEALEQELGVAPDPATTAVYERLRTAAVEAVPVAPPSPLIGRERECLAARQAWDTAARGAARMLLVTGEPGIGKTRLVEELARQAAAEGHAVARARAYEAAGRLPWGPVVDWLRSDALAPSLTQLDEVWRSRLARLVPELVRGTGPAVPGTASPAGRHQLLDAVTRALVAAGRPLLLVLDDLQWCDRATIELCGFLLQRVPGAAVLVAGTARDEDLDEGHPVTDLRARLAAVGTLATVALDRLDPGATTELARALGAPPLSEDARARLWAETEGNPLFVVEAVRAGVPTADPARATALTPTVQALVTARLRRLSPTARELLEVAATIGRAFSPGVLARVTGHSEDDLAGALDELWQRRLVTERGATYDFSHDRLRDVALASISPARRRGLHRAVATALAEADADDLGPVSARIAAHLEAAGLDGAAVEAYERGAAHAYRVFALDEGIDLLHRALRLLDRLPRGTSRDEVELRLRSALGVPLVARHGYGASSVEHSYERALTLHRRLGRAPSPDVLRGLALHAVVTCRFERASELAGELLAAGAGDRTAAVEGHYVLGVVRFWAGDLAGSVHHLGAALAAYRPEDAPRHIARYAQDPGAVCRVRLGLTRHFLGQRADADEAFAAALRLAAELDHPMTTGYVRAFGAVRAALAPEEHDLPAAVAALEAVTSPLHIGYFETMATLLGGWRDVLAGDRRGVAVMQEVVRRWHEEQQLHLTLGLSLLAQAHLRGGEVGQGRAVVADALAWTERAGQRYLLAELLRLDAELLAAGGDVAAAAARARSALAAATEQGAAWLCDRVVATTAAWGPADRDRGTPAERSRSHRVGDGDQRRGGTP